MKLREFAREIRHDFQSDDARLVFADYLEDHGSDWADLIRVQCKIATLTGFDPWKSSRELQALRALESRILSKHRASFLNLWSKAPSVMWRRGFPDRIAIRPGQLTQLKSLLEEWPVSHVWLQGVRRRSLRRLANVVNKFQIPSVQFRTDDYPKPEPFDGEFDTGVLATLEHLQAVEINGYALKPSGLQHLLQLPSLRILKLPNNQLGDAGIEMLSHWKGLQHLDLLDLANNEISDRGYEALSKSEFLSGRTHLSLGGSIDTRNDASIEIAVHTALRNNLYSFSLKPVQYHQEALSPLETASELPKLRVVALSQAPVGDRGAEYISNSPAMKAVRALDLSTLTWVGQEGATRIAESEMLSKLYSLSFGMSPMGAGIPALARSKTLKNLRSLSLCAVGLGDDELHAIVTSDNWRELLLLDVGNSHFGDRGVKSILDSDKFPKLQYLGVGDTDATDESGQLLLDEIMKIPHVDWDINNHFSDPMKEKLNERFPPLSESRITFLRLSEFPTAFASDYSLLSESCHFG